MHVCAPMVQILCFSMDRVFQLSEYLRTLHQFLCLDGVSLLQNHQWADISIICKCSSADILIKYQELDAKYPHVTFLYEHEHDHGFVSCLLHAISQETTAEWLLFNVDDAFYFDPVELRTAVEFFTGVSTQSDALRPFSFHLKLAPSLWRSHLTNKAMLPLPRTFQYHPQGFLSFQPATGVLDWNYPWELSGSLYRRTHVQSILHRIRSEFGDDGIRNPNFLELRGHQVLSKLFKLKDLVCGCWLRPKMHVFAINQVQDTFQNRLYDSVEGELTDLMQLYLDQKQLDDAYYRHHNCFSSVHIGKLVLQCDHPAPSEESTAPLVSVVMPAFNAEAFVADAIMSILNQTYQNLELLVLDDASTDATPAIVQQLAAADARIQLIRHKANQGVAKTLNHGFQLARGQFIARMDADDVALSRRLQRQVEFLQAHSDIQILGTSIVIQPSSSSSSSSVLEAVLYPSTPQLTQWRMWFGCFLAHPTVMMRREVVPIVTQHDGFLYDPSRQASEDYDLWLRCLVRHQMKATSLAEPLLMYRKHATNASKCHRTQQQQETQGTVALMMQEFLQQTIPMTHVEAALSDTTNSTIDDLKGAMQLIQNLLQTYKEKEEDEEQQCEYEYLQADAASRQGALALRAFLSDPVDGARLWSEFATKHPTISRQAFAKLAK